MIDSANCPAAQSTALQRGGVLQETPDLDNLFIAAWDD
jgi:hypothetical protein